jgi:HEAT repeat protein
MTSAQALGRLALAKVEIADPLDQLVELLGDDHNRVRAAAATALSRIEGHVASS